MTTCLNHRWEYVGSGNYQCRDCDKPRCRHQDYAWNRGSRCDEAVSDAPDAEMCAGHEAWAEGMHEFRDELRETQMRRAA